MGARVRAVEWRSQESFLRLAQMAELKLYGADGVQLTGGAACVVSCLAGGALLILITPLNIKDTLHIHHQTLRTLCIYTTKH